MSSDDFSSPTPSRAPFQPDLTLADTQRIIHRMYHTKDSTRGIEGTFMWFMEEVGELAGALRGTDRRETAREFADVLAWLVTMANIHGVDLAEAFQEKYGGGCPGCGAMECVCGTEEKP